MNEAGVARGDVAKLVIRLDGDVDGRSRDGRGRRGDGEVAGAADNDGGTGGERGGGVCDGDRLPSRRLQSDREVPRAVVSYLVGVVGRQGISAKGRLCIRASKVNCP